MSTTTSSSPVPGVIGTTTASPTVSTVAVSTASSAVSIRLSPTKVCADSASVAETTDVLISQRFAVDPTNVDTLKAEMVAYFSNAFANNEQIIFFMTELKSWPDVNKAGTSNTQLNHTSVHVVLLITYVAEYTDKMLLAGYFLSNVVPNNDFSS